MARASRCRGCGAEVVLGPAPEPTCPLCGHEHGPGGAAVPARLPGRDPEAYQRRLRRLRSELRRLRREAGAF